MATGPVVTAGIQLVTVPLLLHAWGAAKYGDWLLLSAIPSYLTLSDLGFGDASGSDMSMKVAAGDRDGAVETFQSSWVLVTGVSLAALLMALVSVWWIPWQRWLKLSSVSGLQAATIMLVLAAYVVAAQQNGVTESGYRCGGQFATGTFWATMLRLIEVSAATAVAVFGGSLLAVALTYLAVRIPGSLAYAWLLRRKSPWIHFGVRRAKLTTVKRLAAPAFGFVAFPLGTALSLQGMTILIGSLLGPLAVVTFSVLRTLSRLNVQLFGVITNALWPELSRAFGAGNISLARRLHRHAWQASLGLSLCGGVVMWVLGPWIFNFWVRQNVTFNANCFHVLLLVAVSSMLWSASSVILISINDHWRIAAVYVGATALSLGLARLLIPELGITGGALALLVTEGAMTGLALHTALRHVQDSLKKFLPAIIAIQRFSLQGAPEP
jgi:O-antigen/teichoic acid export membrane protein